MISRNRYFSGFRDTGPTTGARLFPARYFIPILPVSGALLLNIYMSTGQRVRSRTGR